MAQIILAVLATWRVTSLLVYEEGPANIFARLRKRSAGSPLKGLLDCFWCASVWVAAPVAVLAWWSAWRMMALGWLAASAGAIIVDNLMPEREVTDGSIRKAE
jgi:hypothetical protein